jgi:hypothetical protein
VRPAEFFLDDEIPAPYGDSRRRVDVDLLTRIRTGQLDGFEGIEVAVPLAILIHDELEKYGTSGGQEMSEQEMRQAILALRAVTERLATASPEIPFREFGSFRSWWLRNDAYNSWQARRNLLHGLFDPLHDQLALLEQRSLLAILADPISSHKRTGWPAIDTEISELRRHFQNARTAQDYRSIGLDCVAVLAALSAQVYDPALHLRDGEPEPPVANTKQRLERYVEDAMPGSDNAALRKLARAAIEFALQVKQQLPDASGGGHRGGRCDPPRQPPPTTRRSAVNDLRAVEVT